MLRVLVLCLGATVLYGWVLMVYPVLSASAIRFWSLTLGYTLGALGGFFRYFRVNERFRSLPDDLRPRGRCHCCQVDGC